MFEKAKIWFESLSSLVKSALAITGMVAVLGGYLTIHDKKVIEKYKGQNELTDIKAQLIDVLKNQEKDKAIRKKTNDLVDSLKVNFNSNMGLMTKEVTGLKVSNGNLKNYLIQNAATKNDLQRIYDIFDVEKKKD